MISIHVPRTGDDDRRKAHCPRNQYFNPRPPCGGRHANIPVEVLLNGISIHVPCTGDDFPAGLILRTGHISIHVPRTGDDKYTQAIEQKSNISIHVPRAGDDASATAGNGSTVNFNPRPPCGGRRIRNSRQRLNGQFQSTSPVRGTTLLADKISIKIYLFQSTSPVRGTTSLL